MLWLDDLSNEGHIRPSIGTTPATAEFSSGGTFRTEAAVQRVAAEQGCVPAMHGLEWDHRGFRRPGAVTRGEPSATDARSPSMSLCVKSCWPETASARTVHTQEHHSRTRDRLLRWIYRTATAGNTSDRWGQDGSLGG